MPADPTFFAPTAPPTLWRVVTLCVAWAGVVTVHYWLCGWCAWRLGDPTELPRWLEPWNELMQYGISGFLSLLLAAVWWAIAGALFVPGALAVRLLDRLLLRAEFVVDAQGRPPGAAFGQSLAAMAPVFGLTWLSLLILPFEAPYKPDDSGLQTADLLSYPAFAEYMFLSLFGILTIYVLAAGFAGGVAVMMRLGDGGAWQILPPVFSGIVAAMTFGLVVGPWALKLPHALGVFPATACFIFGATLLSVPPLLALVRR